ncbi:putative RNA recognition motif domain, nucleotide-binding alpha-beta plait domain superfamily [Helianthus annuus]|uniref:RNA recognition motif domain, nucleotide-binding alpha-beta plait domain superfamily n=2 Tax=Helianthus annuus TaxID=4232 RepID=A0A9K3DW60_HELAN|nr:binding partner of ACD11 1 isoform X2 [Helianthus annuus]KAF5761988.1 putative RNA recognition motif domain, nucleotide-binding alpha-beta plait domain superfamily [Helianthus annuus]KAJ0823084.1 putative RNA recognition motif domain, nucleotide-binding alpha-beta plait domain superfamily [Helianthus annuus]
MAATESKTETEVPPTTGNASETKTVEVSNVSMTVTEKDIREFFSFSGNIHYVEMKSESETTQRAFVTFKESKGAHTALLLTGATIGDLLVSLSPVENYQLPAGAPPLTPTDTDGKSEVAQQAEEVVSTMLAKGFVLGKDALQKAKSFDEKHQLTSNASATAVSIDQKMGLTQKLSTGTAVVNEKMKEVDERYQVSEATKSAVTKAEKKANDAGSALMSNKYVSNGAVWIAGAFAAVAKAAEGVGSKTKKKVHEAEEEKEGSKTKDSVQKAEGSNKDSSVSPVKPSNENNKLPNQ